MASLYARRGVSPARMLLAGGITSLALCGIVSASSIANAIEYQSFGEEQGYIGEVELSASSVNGVWKDPTGTSHQNGTYLVTIPKKISWTELDAGVVSTEPTEYTVNVRGCIDDEKKVVLSATQRSCLQMNSEDTQLFENTTQQKTEWTALECFGDADDSIDGNQPDTQNQLMGTNSIRFVRLGTPSDFLKSGGEESLVF